jgi:hypothetical protein
MKNFKMPSMSELFQREDEFFSKDFMMSYSGLNKLMFSPKLFYMHYVLNQRDDTTDKAALEGKLIHCLLLNPEDFENEYVLMATDFPSDNPKEVLHRLFAHYSELKEQGDPRCDLEHFGFAILDILKDMNLYQSLKTDQQRIEKIIIPKHVSYWEYLKTSQNKINVDQQTYDYAKEIVEQIKNNNNILEIMGFVKPEFTSNIEVFNEIELASFPENLPFGLRGFIDNLVLDHSNKVIRVNDLKTTSKDIKSFKDSIEYYNYWMQTAIYYKLVKGVYLSLPEYNDYKFEFRFIIVDNYTQIAPIRVTEETLEKWLTQTDECLKQAVYHFDNKNFSLPYELLINNEIVI